MFEVVVKTKKLSDNSEQVYFRKVGINKDTLMRHAQQKVRAQEYHSGDEGNIVFSRRGDKAFALLFQGLDSPQALISISIDAIEVVN